MDRNGIANCIIAGVKQEGEILETWKGKAGAFKIVSG